MDQSDTPQNEAGSASLSALAGPFLSPASFWQPVDVMESAWLTHGPFAFWLVDALRPRSIVELGTHRGFSFLAFCQAVERLGLSSTCYALDTWQGDDHAGFYGDEVFSPLSQRVNETYPGFATLVRGTFAQSRPYFPDGATDLLHIDGRHGYDDVREDFELWRSNVSDRGVILFHDTNVRERDFGVWRLWRNSPKNIPRSNSSTAMGSASSASARSCQRLCRGCSPPARPRRPPSGTPIRVWDMPYPCNISWTSNSGRSEPPMASFIRLSIAARSSKPSLSIV